MTRFLEKINRDACIGYLEHLINVLGMTSAPFHDKLSELYLNRVRVAASKQDEGEPLTVKRGTTLTPDQQAGWKLTCSSWTSSKPLRTIPHTAH